MMNTSKRRRIGLVAGALACLTSTAQATNQDDFLVRNTADIVALCSTAPGDPLYIPAMNFCQGYLVGIYQYQDDFFHGAGLTPVVCPPAPKPTRNQTVMDYLAWSKAHPQYANDLAVNSFMKFLVDTWPCKS